MDMRERQVQMKRRASVRFADHSAWIFLGLLLGAVSLFCGCGNEEAVFTAGEARQTVEIEEALGAVPDGTENELAAGDEAAGSETIEEQGAGQAPGGSQLEAVPQLLAVYVCGQVEKPGVYELEQGSRIADAIALAGGMTEEAATDAWNLAQLLTDAQMIRVPSREEAEALKNETAEGGIGRSEGVSGEGAAGAAAPGMDADGRISLNEASKVQLMTLPGIGEAKAEAILKYRSEHGSFDSIEEIMNIPGIKEGVFSKIKDQITI